MILFVVLKVMVTTRGSAGVASGEAGRGIGRGRVPTRSQAAATGGTDTASAAAVGVSAVAAQAIPRTQRVGRGRAGQGRVTARGATWGRRRGRSRGRGRATPARIPLEEEVPDTYPEEVGEGGAEAAAAEGSAGGVAEVPAVPQGGEASSVQVVAGQQPLPYQIFMTAQLPGGGTTQIPLGTAPAQGAQSDAGRAEKQKGKRFKEFINMAKGKFDSFSGGPDPLAARE